MPAIPMPFKTDVELGNLHEALADPAVVAAVVTVFMDSGVWQYLYTRDGYWFAVPDPDAFVAVAAAIGTTPDTIPATCLQSLCIAWEEARRDPPPPGTVSSVYVTSLGRAKPAKPANRDTENN